MEYIDEYIENVINKSDDKLKKIYSNIKNGIIPYSININDISLIISIKYGQYDISIYFLQYFNINRKYTSNEYTALMIASIYNNINVVKYLVNKYCKINSLSKNNESALLFACRYGNIEIVKYLLNNKALFSNNLNDEFIQACEHNQVNVFNYITISNKYKYKYLCSIFSYSLNTLIYYFKNIKPIIDIENANIVEERIFHSLILDDKLELLKYFQSKTNAFNYKNWFNIQLNMCKYLIKNNLLQETDIYYINNIRSPHKYPHTLNFDTFIFLHKSNIINKENLRFNPVNVDYLVYDFYSNVIKKDTNNFMYVLYDNNINDIYSFINSLIL